MCLNTYTKQTLRVIQMIVDSVWQIYGQQRAQKMVSDGLLKPVFLMNKNFIHKTKKNYKQDTRASSLMIISKQGGPKPTSKDSKTLFKKDYLARE